LTKENQTPIMYPINYKNYLPIFIIILFFLSCTRNTDCNIEPIRLNVIDTINLKGDFVFKNQLGENDTLLLIDHYNIFENITKKSLMTYVECGHGIGFNYDSSEKKGTINISLDKNDKNEYVFSINGFCINQNIKMNQREVEKDSMIIINIKKCDESKFKTIAFKKFRIEYFITQDGNVWKPIKFLPR
jgi:hypothetical protein